VPFPNTSVIPVVHRPSLTVISHAQLDRATQEALVAELDSTIRSIANFFFCSAGERCSVCILIAIVIPNGIDDTQERHAWADIPDGIRAYRQEILTDELTVEDQYRRIHHLVNDVNEVCCPHL
jgi:uncharacterized membrane-anchored protein